MFSEELAACTSSVGFNALYMRLINSTGFKIEDLQSVISVTVLVC